MVRTIIEEQGFRARKTGGPDSGSRIIEHGTAERETLMHNLRYYSGSHVSIADATRADVSFVGESPNASAAIRISQCEDSGNRSRENVRLDSPAVSWFALNL